jgi:hypothetical protein
LSVTPKAIVAVLFDTMGSWYNVPPLAMAGPVAKRPTSAAEIISAFLVIGNPLLD